MFLKNGLEKRRLKRIVHSDKGLNGAIDDRSFHLWKLRRRFHFYRLFAILQWCREVGRGGGLVWRDLISATEQLPRNLNSTSFQRRLECNAIPLVVMQLTTRPTSFTLLLPTKMPRSFISPYFYEFLITNVSNNLMIRLMVNCCTISSTYFRMYVSIFNKLIKQCFKSNSTVL